MEQPPLIDISCFGENMDKDSNEKIATAASLQNACREIGFFYIKSNIIDQSSIEDAISTIKHLFDLPDEVKESANASNSALFRGYQGVASPSHSCAPGYEKNIKELKESFSIGATGQSSPMHGENQWPNDCPIFIKQKMEKHWDAMVMLTRQVVRCLALSLGLKEDFFLKEMSDPIAQMVSLRYPPTPSASLIGGKQIINSGCNAHTDCGFLTLLVQEKDPPPLQIKNANGFWVDAPQIDGYVLCNLGDMAERWSNGFYRSSWHRVANNSQEARHSLPFFCNLNYGAVVDPSQSVCQGKLKSLIGDAKFKPVLAGEYICEKLNLMYKQKSV